MIEEALVEALAQEHFNYIAEGDSPSGQALPQDSVSCSQGLSCWRGWWRRFSPQTAMSVATLVVTVMLARHLKDSLVDFAKEAFSDAGGSDDGRSRARAELGISR